MSRLLISIATACALTAAITSSALAQFAAPLTEKQAVLRGMPLPQRLEREPTVSKLIVKLRNPTADERARPLGTSRINGLSRAAGVALKSVRPMSGDATVVALPAATPLSHAWAVAAQLSRDPAVEYAEPDVLLKKAAVPSEPRYVQWQWNLFAPTTTYSAASGAITKQAPAAGGANLPPAWDITTGSASVVVAVLDTGIVNHSDLNLINGGPAYTPSGRFLPGYDFVSSEVGAGDGLPPNFVANDGDGRDPDPTDPGDWVTGTDKSQYPNSCDDGEPGPSDSSWHGTHTTGVIAATANNGVGIAGVGWQIRVVPVRVLGKCGGSLSDVADAIRWSAGLPVPNVPDNPTPAQVLNLSLGGSGSCSQTMQSAVNAVNTAGSVLVAATGNSESITIGQPANCTGVIAVTAHTINGENAVYADVGPAAAISAPGGGPPLILGKDGPTDDSSWPGYYVWSTVLFAPMGPASTDGSGRSGSAYTGFTGTSAAAPHVAGVAALLKSVLPNATPTEVRNLIVANARPFPAGSACAPGGVLVGQCGSGLLDAGRALQAAVASAAPVIFTQPQSVTVQAGTSATFAVVASGAGALSYQWHRDGAPIAGANGSSYTTGATTTADNGAMFSVTVTNSLGAVTSAAATLTVTPSSSGGTGTPVPPPNGSPAAPPAGGGGGSVPFGQLLLLLVALAAARGYRPRQRDRGTA